MKFLETIQFEDTSIVSVLLSLTLSLVFSFILRWHFIHFGKTLSNRENFSSTFPYITATTMLIIIIVKSSLALSLGLIGALSIIRFRTPVKEPEELAYLFIAISIGIGFGANYILITSVVVSILLIVMARFSSVRLNSLQQHLYLTIDIPERPNENTLIDQLTEAIARRTEFCDLHRLEMRNQAVQVTYFVDIAAADSVSTLLDEIESIVPGSEVNLLDQKRIPGV
jgi:uncharacterized membrane protein YhiD involved in acid resistance